MDHPTEAAAVEAREIARLFEAAEAARARAYAPYSGFGVGAAVLSASGAIHAGCNVENAAYPSGTCAEQAAISAMVTAGERRIVAIAVTGPGDAPVMPCGACRQRILEFSGSMTMIHATCAGGARRDRPIAELLPDAFGPATLAGARSP